MNPLTRAARRAAVAAAATLALAPAAASADVARSASALFPYPGSDVTLVNHRGLSPGFPENTLSAFRNSIAMGVDAIEIDLRTTKDGEIVILHDATVDRTTDGTGPVSALTLAEVKALDAGSHLSPQFAGERVPTFEETLQVVKGSGVRLLLDIKVSSVTERAVQLVEQYQMIDDVIVGPRNLTTLAAFKALNPRLTTLGFIATPADADAMIAAGVDYIRLWPEWITASRDSADCRADHAARVAAFERGERDHPGSASCLLEHVAAQGTPVWSTVDDLPYETMDELIRLGATGLLSDLPAELDRLLTDLDGRRVVAAKEQIRALDRALAADHRHHGGHGRRAASRHRHREDHRVAEVRRLLDRAAHRLRRGDRAGACGALAAAAGRLAVIAPQADHAWAAREVTRVLACAQG